jgi:uncharacterized membrane protein YphA (DoxX/SURF4 family)
LNKAAFRRIFLSPFAELALRWVLGITFVYASLHKIASPADFAEIVFGYKLVPDFSINIIAVGLPFMELFFGAALILGVYPRSASLGVSLLLAGFILALSINTFRGVEFDCGCFGMEQTAGHESMIKMIVRDIFSLMAGIYVCWFPFRRKWSALQSGSITHNHAISSDETVTDGQINKRTGDSTVHYSE